MPIRWSALKVNDAMDEVENYIEQARGPLKQAREAVEGARSIPDLPQYIDLHLIRIITEINRTIGGSRWDPEGSLKTAIESVRKSLPKEALEREKQRLNHGSQAKLQR